MRILPMRILFVSNLYPPFARGGYEQWCEEVAQMLVARGHTVAVLTARGGSQGGDTSTQESAPAVYRLLTGQVEGGLMQTALRLARGVGRIEADNVAHTQRLLAEFAPDAVLVWGMWNIDRAVPQQLERQAGSSVAYYFCDYWPSLPNAYIQRLREPARRRSLQLVKSVLGRCFLPGLVAADAAPLRLEHPICVSHAVRTLLVRGGVAVDGARIVYGGTHVEEFNAPRPAAPSVPVRLLYMGRLEPLKGVHTVIEAMRLLPGGLPVVLDILGAGVADYVAELKAVVMQGGLEDRVHFLGAVRRSAVPAVLAEHDVLLFSSEWEEPFARSVLEAMAAGLAVIGTTTGGTGEILRHAETGLTYPAGDAVALAAQIERLAQDAELRRQLSAAGSRLVRRCYTIGRMVDELEVELQAIARPTPVTS